MICPNNQVFSLHDPAELWNFITGAGFREVTVQSDTKSLRLPAPEEFLWQYVHSTPLAGVLGPTNDEFRASPEREVVARWQESVKDGALML